MVYMILVMWLLSHRLNMRSRQKWIVEGSTNSRRWRPDGSIVEDFETNTTNTLAQNSGLERGSGTPVSFLGHDLGVARLYASAWVLEAVLSA